MLINLNPKDKIFKKCFYRLKVDKKVDQFQQLKSSAALSRREQAN